MDPIQKASSEQHLTRESFFFFNNPEIKVCSFIYLFFYSFSCGPTPTPLYTEGVLL